MGFWILLSGGIAGIYYHTQFCAGEQAQGSVLMNTPLNSWTIHPALPPAAPVHTVSPVEWADYQSTIPKAQPPWKGCAQLVESVGHTTKSLVKGHYIVVPATSDPLLFGDLVVFEPKTLW